MTIDRIASLLVRLGDNQRKRDAEKVENLISGKLISDVGEAFTQVRTELDEEFKPKLDEFESQIKNAQSIVDRTDLEHRRHLLVSEKHSELVRRFSILGQKYDREREGYQEESELEAELTKYVTHHEKNLVRILRAYLRLYWLNFFIEVVFPAGLGIFASLLSFGLIG